MPNDTIAQQQRHPTDQILGRYLLPSGAHATDHHRRNESCLLALPPDVRASHRFGREYKHSLHPMAECRTIQLLSSSVIQLIKFWVDTCFHRALTQQITTEGMNRACSRFLQM